MVEVSEETETVNMAPETKLSKLQKCILKNLMGNDSFYGEDVTALSRTVAGQTDRILNSKFRASFSRSLSRLEKRGLITKITDTNLEEQDGQWVQVIYTGGRRTKYVKLTPKGKEVSDVVG